MRRRIPMSRVLVLVGTFSVCAAGAERAASVRGAQPSAIVSSAQPPASVGGAGPLDEAAAARFAHLALACLHKEYPNKIAHVMLSDADALPPHLLTPAFYGCFDWHSDVHGHWLLGAIATVR